MLMLQPTKVQRMKPQAWVNFSFIVVPTKEVVQIQYRSVCTKFLSNTCCFAGLSIFQSSYYVNLTVKTSAWASTVEMTLLHRDLFLAHPSRWERFSISESTPIPNWQVPPTGIILSITSILVAVWGGVKLRKYPWTRLGLAKLPQKWWKPGNRSHVTRSDLARKSIATAATAWGKC